VGEFDWPQVGEVTVAARALRPVLHFAITEGPILTARIDEIDPHVFLSHASLRMDLLGDVMEELLLHFGRSAADPRDLDDDEIARVFQAEISFLRVDDLVCRVTADDLELVVHRDIGDVHHGSINRLAYDADEFGRRILADVNSG
jgi:hypothetical protein